MAYAHKKQRLGDILLAENIITPEDLNEALEKQKDKKVKLGEMLVNLGATNENAIAEALKKQLAIEMIHLPEIKIPNQVLSLVDDAAILKRYGVIPFELSEDEKSVKLAMGDPMDLMAIDDMGVVTGCRIIPVISTPQEIYAAIDKYYGSAEAKAVADQYTKEAEDKNYEEEDAGESEEILNSPIVKMARTIIEQAARQGASDIHIEPFEDRLRIRNRIDGVLVEVGTYSPRMLPALVARYKIIGGMDIAEKRKPQDGRITQVVDRTEYDIRVSILPTVYGEKIVMRLAAKTALTRDKALLGFTPDELEKFDGIMSNPNGVILVTGPTGSGKSTTLYTALSELNTEDVNIITVEDPVEANIDGINQVQVNPKADLTFASALRSILRQDPDIIMIGEIRDGETANIAVTASITGHLVVSTLHTNSAAASITRLADMGLEPYLIADATVGIIAQRLVRKLCTCKKPHKATQKEKDILGIGKIEKDVRIYEPGGCVKCNDTGYKGRTGVYEIMPITKHMRDAIADGLGTEELETMAIKNGMKTLRMAASRKVLQGITSMKELERITYAND